jgi:hypothetical protein
MEWREMESRQTTRKWKGPMKDLLQILAFVGVWILLQRVILPRLGIGT